MSNERIGYRGPAGPAGANGADGTTWRTLYNRDYSALSTSAAFTSGTVTIDGVAWRYREQNTLITKQVTAGQGIQLQTNAGKYGTLTVPLLSLCDDLSFSRRFVVDVHMTHTVAAYNFMVGLTDTSRDNTTPDVDWNNNGVGLLVRQGYSSSATIQTLFKYGATETTVHDTGLSTGHDVFRFVVDGPIFSFWTGSWAAGWPVDANMVRRGSKFWSQSTSEQVLNANLGLVIALAAAVGTLTVGNIRILES
jgi:hypothetical protein